MFKMISKILLAQISSFIGYVLGRPIIRKANRNILAPAQSNSIKFVHKFILERKRRLAVIFSILQDFSLLKAPVENIFGDVFSKAEITFLSTILTPAMGS